VGQYLVGEPSKLDMVTMNDNLRGGLTASKDGVTFYHLDGAPQGYEDGLGAVTLLTLAQDKLWPTAFAGPLSPTGRSLVRYSMGTGLTGSLLSLLPGTSSYAVSLATTPNFAYVAEYSDVSSSAGQFLMVDLDSGETTTLLSGLTGVRAVATLVGDINYIFVATTETYIDRLRIYRERDERGELPTLLSDVKLFSRCNSITIIPGTGSVTARVFVSMAERLSIYNFFRSDPTRLIESYVSGFPFYKVAIAENGTIFATAGNSGIIVLDQFGHFLYEFRCSGKEVRPWEPMTPYDADAVTTPRESHPFFFSKYYFRSLSTGYSGDVEPDWNPLAKIADGGVTWIPQGFLDGVVVDAVIEPSNKRLYAVGVAGGILGTEGRVWSFDAKAFL
jgi:hypothetical protein